MSSDGQIVSNGKRQARRVCVIMPMDKSKYPVNWSQISLEIKERAGWICEQCKKQCRKPGEPFDSHTRTLTVAHINHVESDCRDDNLIALCAPCHLRYDAPRKALQRIVAKRARRMTMAPGLSVDRHQPRQPYRTWYLTRLYFWNSDKSQVLYLYIVSDENGVQVSSSSSRPGAIEEAMQSPKFSGLPVRFVANEK